MRCDGIDDGFEPALKATIERIVIPALVVRLMRLPGDGALRDSECGEAPAAIPSTIGHIKIQPEMLPA
jgi:hypothetical protein